MTDYESALALYEDTLELIARAPDSVEAEYYIRNLVKTGIYEHFKSTETEPKFYAVMGAGRYGDNGPYSVSYHALYPPNAGQLALRRLVGPNPTTGAEDAFLMPVKRGEYAGPRFRLVQECTLQELTEVEKKYMSA